MDSFQGKQLMGLPFGIADHKYRTGMLTVAQVDDEEKSPFRLGNPRFRPADLITQHLAGFHKAQPLQYSYIDLRVWIRRGCSGRHRRGVRRYCSGFESINKGTKRRDHPFGLPVFALRHCSAGRLKPLQGSSPPVAGMCTPVLISTHRARFEAGQEVLNFL